MTAQNVDPTVFNLDPDPEFRPKLDPDPEFCYQYLKKLYSREKKF